MSCSLPTDYFQCQAPFPEHSRGCPQPSLPQLPCLPSPRCTRTELCQGRGSGAADSSRPLSPGSGWRGQLPERFPALPSRQARLSPARPAAATAPPRAGTPGPPVPPREGAQPERPAARPGLPPFPTHQLGSRASFPGPHGARPRPEGRAGPGPLPPAARPEQRSTDGGTALHRPQALRGHGNTAPSLTEHLLLPQRMEHS